jgi:hypothetical protein
MLAAHHLEDLKGVSTEMTRQSQSETTKFHLPHSCQAISEMRLTMLVSNLIENPLMRTFHSFVSNTPRCAS